jgi:voltage-gated potassium channel
MNADGSVDSIRDRYNAFIVRHEVAWELAMAAVAIVWVALGFVDDVTGAVPVVEGLLTTILMAEFGTRLAATRDRRTYVRNHWIDAVALVPLPLFRGLRVFRLLRLLRLVRAFAGIYRALVHVEEFASHRQLVWLVVTWLGVAVICSSLLYLAEVGANPLINEPFDAAWWGVVTLTTVGYGDIFPVTQEGRIAAGALMFLGITLFAAITGTITSRFVLRGTESANDDVPDLLRQLSALRDEEVLTEDECEEGGSAGTALDVVPGDGETRPRRVRPCHLLAW